MAKKTQEEIEAEKAVARKILQNNPKLRDQGFDTVAIAERAATARRTAKGTTSPATGLDASEVDEAKEKYLERIAQLDAQIAKLQQDKQVARREAQDAVKSFIGKHSKAADQAALAHALSLRRSFLEKIGWRG